MTYNQPKLFALPARYHNLQQPPQIAKELAIQFHPLSGMLGAFERGGGPLALLADLRLVYRGGFLLGNGIADAVDEGEGKGHVDGTRDLGAMRQIEGCEMRYHGSQLGFGRTGGEEELGLDRHNAMGVGILEGEVV